MNRAGGPERDEKPATVRVRLAADVLAADLAEGLSVAEIGERHGLPSDYVYGPIRRLGLKLNRRTRPSDWTGLAEDLLKYRPREIAEQRGTSVGAVYWAANYYGIRHLITPARTIDHDLVRADLAADEVAAAHGISAASVYRISKLQLQP